MSGFGFLLGLFGSQAELAGTWNILRDAEPSVIEVARLISGERLRAPDGQLLKADHRVREGRHLDRYLSQRLPMFPRRGDHWALRKSFLNQGIESRGRGS